MGSPPVSFGGNACAQNTICSRKSRYICLSQIISAGIRDALAECLEDLEWLRGLTYAVVIDGANEILVDEPPEQLKVFFRVIDRVAAYWADPVMLGEDWDRPAIPFHWVLRDSPEGRTNLEARLGSVIQADISFER